MLRTLKNNMGSFRVNELVYNCKIVRAVTTQGTDEISAIKILALIDSISTVDEEGNILSVSNDAMTWEPFEDTGVEAWLGVEMEETI